ncbi:hypothetical protein [Ancylobacter sp. G4_0304]|uniref:hypothetical protein n=1 Tax=Ancylobacter sp. G4_0304 TaxID=3114289 RepID=UPI0039C5CF2D
MKGKEQKTYLAYELEGDRLARAGRLDAARDAYGLALELKPDAAWIEAKRDRLGESAPPADEAYGDAPGRALYLFVPFYTPKDAARAEELLFCLDRNLANGAFAQIVLLVDDDTPPPRFDFRLKMIRLDHRPTYQDWIEASRRICPGRISILANSDLFFDNTIGRISEIFDRDPRAFIALSRFDKEGDRSVPHPHPHWSQDTWAFIPDAGDDTSLDANFAVPLGVPRCDNKIAYLFSVFGYSIYNPFPFVRSVHVHETNLRHYDKKRDRRVSGGVAMVHPGESLTDPARLDVEIWSQNVSQFASLRFNRTFERWDEEYGREMTPRPAWLGYDDEWQYPAITEKHAFERMRASLPEEKALYDTVYFGFPFATLIDLINTVGPNNPRTRELQGRLDGFAEKLSLYKRVVTVCQHIRGRDTGHLFAKAGITDLFWSHNVVGETSFPKAPATRVLPFPLYPVQQVATDDADIRRTRRWLFSFVGAKATPVYLTKSRNMIIDLLKDDPRGMVVDRDAWHYQQIVYDHQIMQRSETATGLVNDCHSSDFKAIMNDSVFSLCPSGSGPNTIRL